MQRDVDTNGRPARSQYTTYQTTYTSSRSRPGDSTRQTMSGSQNIRGPSQPGTNTQNYPRPPSERPFRAVRLAQAATITPGQSISQVDRQLGWDHGDGRPTFARADMPRGSSNLMSVPDSQFRDRRDGPGYFQGPNTLYRPNNPQVGAFGREGPVVVNNYITNNNHVTYNIDNSRHERVNARGQRNNQNFLYMSTRNNRRDTVEDSRTQQRISGSSGRLNHHREHRG
ncbi:hypothetical protein DHEL01_v202613 [Diaporthe helianthi]|uniref:Uncharacterized protein n=1 Tax=Diaporthe helianthi TaxID=158607 RepID=A0A2P5I949_DIAHE|nr:hypothetical protein DHEL01_v202613 [Diaporthe helianthi]